MLAQGVMCIGHPPSSCLGQSIAGPGLSVSMIFLVPPCEYYCSRSWQLPIQSIHLIQYH